MVRHKALYLLLAVLVFGANVRVATMAQGTDDVDGVMSASAFRPVPDDSRLTIQIADDTDINLRLRDVAERLLRRAGYTIVSEKPTFTLRLESQRISGGVQFDRSIGSLRAGSSVGRPTGNRSGPQGTGVDLNLKLWSSTRNSLLSPKSPGSAPKQGLGIQIEAFDEIARKPAWHGVARAVDSGGDSFRTGSALVRHLVDAFGLTIKEETLSLR